MSANGVLILVIATGFVSGFLLIVEVINRKHGGE